MTAPRYPTVPVERAWNTWSSRPAELVFLPLGVRLTPLAYAASTSRATLFGAGGAVRLGRHAMDGSLIEIELAHAGTRLALRYRKPDPFAVIGDWQTLATGEWGLRFWLSLCIAADDGSPVRYLPDARCAVVTLGHRHVAVAMAEAPALVSGHAAPADLAAEYEREGYWHLASRATEAACLALRCNLEMHRDNRFAAAVADRADLAVARAQELLRAPPEQPALPVQSGRHEGALDAMRDALAWNTLWDAANARPYIALSRNWDQAKFGGFGVWLDDQLYAAAMAARLDPECARETLAAALAGSTPDGNLACLVTAKDAWVDRSQIPVGAFTAWHAAQHGGGIALLARVYPTLARNHDWWWRRRDPGDSGLASYGTSPLGEGLYQGTHFGARNESSMDNAPFHDEARFDPQTGLLDLIDVGLNSLLALDAEVLALIAAELGDEAAATRHAARAAATRRRIGEHLWDERRGIFANRRRGGGFVRSLGPPSFYPLVCGAASPAQVARLVGWLDDPATFGGRFVIPSVTRDDPAFADNAYWRGRIWPPMNFLVWHGLRRAGEEARAQALAAASVDLFRRAWDDRRLCPENFNATTGEPLDQPDTDGFYTWGALMPFLGVCEVMDVTPWDGWTIAHDGTALHLGPVQSPAGPVTLSAADGVLTLRRGGQALLVTDLIGRLRHIRLAPGLLRMTLPAGAGMIGCPAIAPQRVRHCELAGAALAVRAEAAGFALDIPPGPAGRALLLLHDAA